MSKKPVDDNLDLMFLSGDDFDKTEEQQKMKRRKSQSEKKKNVMNLNLCLVQKCA